MPPASRNRFEFCFYRWTAMRLASVPLARWAPLLTVLLALLSTNWRQRLSRLQAGTDSQMAPKDWHSGKNGRHPAPLGELYARKNMYKHTYIYNTHIYIYVLLICIIMPLFSTNGDCQQYFYVRCFWRGIDCEASIDLRLVDFRSKKYSFANMAQVVILNDQFSCWSVFEYFS